MVAVDDTLTADSVEHSSGQQRNCQHEGVPGPRKMRHSCLLHTKTHSGILESKFEAELNAARLTVVLRPDPEARIERSGLELKEGEVRLAGV